MTRRVRPPRRGARRIPWWSCVALVGGVALAACGALDPVPPGLAAPPLWSRLVVPAAEATSRAPLVVPAARWLDRDLAALEHGGPVLYVDLAGRGRSAPLPRDAERSLEDEVADLEALRVERGLERVALFGWAYQGAIAFHYALAHPEHTAALVLVNPLPPTRALWEEAQAALAARLDPAAVARLEALRTGPGKRADVEGYARALTSASLAAFVPDARARAQMRSEPVRLPNLDPDRAARLKARVLARLGDWDWSGTAARLEVPVLVVHGKQGPTPEASARAWADALPRSELLLLPDAGHMPWLDQPDAFASAVGTFLEAHL